MDGDWVWLLVLGLVLTVAGLGVAVWGVDVLSRELFPNSPLPHRSTGRWIKRKLPWPKKHVTTGHGTASLRASLSASGRGYATRPRPADDAPADEWNAYWESRLESLTKRIEFTEGDLREARTKLNQRISEETTERQAADRQLEEQVKRWIGGDQGRGLTLTFTGLSLTLLGTVAQIVAVMLG